MTAPLDRGPSPFEADRRAEAATVEQLAALGLEVDLDRLHRALGTVVDGHPDHDEIVSMIDSGASLFATPVGADELRIEVGWHPRADLVPVGGLIGYRDELGTIPVALVLALEAVAAPSGSETLQIGR
jgi:hypothetical protein